MNFVYSTERMNYVVNLGKMHLKRRREILLESWIFEIFES